MKSLLWKILKTALLLFAVLLVVGLVFGLVLALGWAWWAGFFLLLGLVGIGMGLWMLKRIWLKRREHRFVDQVIAQDESYSQALSSEEKDRHKELQSQWKEAVNTLRKSHLRRRGNPLYVLPWYLVIGESGSGKTTALESANLSSRFVEVKRTSGISGTRNCDWWFFEQAIVLDTAGRYTVRVDDERDRDEWQKFLTLLAKFRRREPLNGLVVTIAADQLAAGQPDELEAQGRNIRRRIDELMRVLGAKFPVYVLVTKCDLIQGMATFCDRLPEKAHAQALGHVNRQLEKEVTTFFKGALKTLTERLRDLRLLLLQQSRSHSANSGLLLFPEELAQLESGLQAFFKGTFVANPYQETPILRGLFFSSGKQEGSPYSHFLKELGMIEARDVLPGTSRGLFLHDFFARILPADRGLFRPTHRALEWRRLTQNLGLTAWLTVGIAICGLLSFSFVKNLKVLRDVSREISKPVVLREEVVADAVTMDRYIQALLRVQETNRGWWLPRFGLTTSIEVEEELKTAFCRRFREGFLSRHDEQMIGVMTGFSSNTPEHLIGSHVAHIVRRINLLTARLQEADLGTLQKRPRASYERVMAYTSRPIITEIGQKLKDIYFYYVLWSADIQALNDELNRMRTWLRHLLTLSSDNLNWIVAWVNLDPDLSGVRLEDLWGGSRQTDPAYRVAPAYTLDGKSLVEAFIAEIEAALIEPTLIAGAKLEFKTWYEQAYFEAWKRFITVFPGGSGRLKGHSEWRQVATAIGSERDPYLALMDIVTQQMEPFAASTRLPSWGRMVYNYQALRLQAAQLAAEGAVGGVLNKATRKVKSKIARLNKTGALGSEAVKDRVAAARSVRQYQENLGKLSGVATSPEIAFKAAAAIYNEDPASGQTTFFEAWRAYDHLRGVMGSARPDQEPFWQMVRGPLDFTLAFVSMEAACRLQKLWEKEVLVEVQGVSDRGTRIKLLVGQDGFARRFVDGPAKPFVTRSYKKGYVAKQVMGHTVPLDPVFFTFVTKGARTTIPQNLTFAVTIRGEPTSANQGAATNPHATELEVLCADKAFRLENFNYPVRKRFRWSSRDCGDVIFRINVGNLILIKEYSGQMAFAKFLADFETGTHRFHARDFPEYEQDLNRLGIRYINVRYRFEGHQPVIALLRAGPGKVPETITQCWGD